MNVVNEQTSAGRLPRLTYSVAEVAQLLGISRGSVYNYIRSGELRCITLGNRIMVPKCVIDDLIESSVA